MRPQEADSFSNGIQSSRDHARIAGRAQVLGRVKAESGRVAQGARLAPIPAGSEGLGSVFDQRHAVLLLELLKAIPLDRLAVEMNRQDGSNLGAGFQACLGRGWTEIEGLRINIREHRLGSGAQNGAGGREKTEGGGNNHIARANFSPFER